MASKPNTRSTKSTIETPETKRSSKGTSVHRVILVGRLVATPELRTTASRIHVTTVRIATNDREQPEFHDVVLWRQLADFATSYMTKGRLAYVEGRSRAAPGKPPTAPSAGRSRSSPTPSRHCRRSEMPRWRLDHRAREGSDPPGQPVAQSSNHDWGMSFSPSRQFSMTASWNHASGRFA
jgi:single stranded DNA-binding protein (ssb)